MLEIILLYKLCINLGNLARERGRKAIGYQLLLVCFWFGGEFGTALMAVVALAVVDENAVDDYFFVIYIAAIAGAAFGAFLAFKIVRGLPPLDEEGNHPDDPL